MTDYRAHMVEEESSPQPQLPSDLGGIALIAQQLGLEDMELHDERSSHQESVDDEFFRYNNAALSPTNVDILNFWVVRDFVLEVIVILAIT